MLSKKPSYFWSAPLSLLPPVLQAVIYYYGFGRINSISGYQDYFWFFLSGLAGGILFIAFLRLSPNRLTQQIVIAAYILAYPASIAVMIIGGLFGPIGVVLLPLVPWSLLMFGGYLIGRRNRIKQTKG